jgi:hypothetical protein
MGRTALFLVLGLGMAMGFIGFQIYRSGEIATDTQYAYLKYMNARNLARTSVHAALRAYDRGQTPPTGVSTYFNNGSFKLNSLSSSSDGDTLWIATEGTYAESTYTMRLTLLRSAKPFPGMNAATAIRATPVSLTLAGGASIDGHNHDSTGTQHIGSGDMPGIATMSGSDSAKVHDAAGKNVDGVPPVAIDISTADPLAFLDIYRNNADTIYNTSGTYSGQKTWGTASKPAIVYCNAGDNPSFSIKFTGGVVAYGILVVRGDVQFNGGLNFYGLVVVDGFNTTVSFGASGTPAIVGGVLIAGNAGASISLKGTGQDAKIVYSSQALNRAKNISKLRYYTILDWYE